MVTFSTERMKETTDGSQLCIINNNLYLKYKLNDADIIGYVDTGMGGEKNLVIYNEYYQRHRNRYRVYCLMIRMSQNVVAWRTA